MKAILNTLESLFQHKRPDGDLKADFSYCALKAMCNDRKIVNILRKRLNKKIKNVKDIQLNQPWTEDFAGWSEITNWIPRNL